ncbi:hypothetical protein EG329_006139 [Mollisiaceae sp. DMI_Dod_QoI]|nr:hypothetical protein EG329_006139 [Helotiales sp. DMI_Dod_QoI]
MIKRVHTYSQKSNALLQPDEETSSLQQKDEMQKESRDLVQLVQNRFRVYDGSERSLDWVDLQIFSDALRFVGSDENFRRVELGISQPLTGVWNLPLEIQLQIVESMPRKKADQAIRQLFPHLASLYIRSIPARNSKWFFNLCSKDNLQYIGTHHERGGGRTYHVYRLRSINLYPGFELEFEKDLGTYEPHASNLEAAQSRLAAFLYDHFFWKKRTEWIPCPHTQSPRGLELFDLEYGESADESDGESYITGVRPVLPIINIKKKREIPWYRKRRMLIDIDSQVVRSTVHPERTEAVDSAVLLFENEISSIFEEMEVFMRPQVIQFYNQLDDTQHDTQCHDDTDASSYTISKYFIPRLRLYRDRGYDIGRIAERQWEDKMEWVYLASLFK